MAAARKTIAPAGGRRFRRSLHAASAAATALGVLLFASGCQTAPAADNKTSSAPVAAADEGAIRPFRVHVAQKEIDELRRRIEATRWPEKETVADQSQGVPLGMTRELAHYWSTGYDWRRVRGETERSAAVS
jgi:Epoxide hydrolase N terminus